MLRYVLRYGPRLTILAAAFFVSALLPAAEAKRNVAAKPADVPRTQVELFAAIESGQIEVKVYPRDSRQLRLVVTNKTTEPLSIAMPEAFAAVPVLAQIGMGGMNPPGQTTSNRSGKDAQPLGTGSPWNMNMFGNQMGNGLGNGMGNGLFNIGNGANQPRFPRAFFNVEPEKVGQMKLRTVCLAHGKPTPNAHMAYEVKPLSQVTTKPGVYELCALLGNEEIGQAAIQAAAWNLANDMSWSKLARVQSRGLLMINDALFTPGQIREGQRLAERALYAAKEREKAASSSKVSQN
jgi:hypothetical protein